MINSYKDITSENPIKEVWKFLKYFQDVEFSRTQHCRIQKISDNEYKQRKSNINKQAKQIGYCIRQAEQYFEAASQVSLATRPILLYYGAVSLSQALILLKKDGDYSFDALRNKDKHNHHGLELSKSFKSQNINTLSTLSVESFFRLLECKCYFNSNQGGIAWGNFPLFYESLVPAAIRLNTYKTFRERIVPLQSTYPLTCSSLRPLQKNNGGLTINEMPIDEVPIDDKTRFNLLSIIKNIPELYHMLTQLKIKPNLCEGSLHLHSTDFMKEKENKRVSKSIAELLFFINNIETTQQEMLNLIYQNKSNHNISIKRMNLI
ncbi:YaaC family protein [Anabaena lutea]|uniref:Uncharacterized protein n=1 Tax=Anabaena lutea FACHB-196 TaxID=2692881 RepID=A0ABR8FMJ9_9NOST|nr:YaaC family protein [Anabaena lutea]MBD2571056.1 hypothetical protein [Anabaena lutea FACHB-196]